MSQPLYAQDADFWETTVPLRRSIAELDERLIERCDRTGKQLVYEDALPVLTVFWQMGGACYQLDHRQHEPVTGVGSAQHGLRGGDGMTAPGVRMSCCPHAEVVDDLRDKLPPQYMKLEEIARMLAIDEHTILAPCELLAALTYLEKRGEVDRKPFKGWCRRQDRNGWRRKQVCQPRSDLSRLAREVGVEEASYEAEVSTGGAADNRGPDLFGGSL